MIGWTRPRTVVDQEKGRLSGGWLAFSAPLDGGRLMDVVDRSAAGAERGAPMRDTCLLPHLTGQSGKTSCNVNDKRIVVCSQPRGPYLGTSVTNAFELILEQLRLTKGAGKWFNLFQPIESPSKWAKWEHGKTVWLEHYPVGASVLEGRYTLMSVSLPSGQPSWGPNMSWERMAARLRVPAETLAYGYESELEIIPIQLDWPGFATKVAVAMANTYSNSNPAHQEWVDEFVVRHALRIHFGRLIPGLDVQQKEFKYPNDQRRLDLTLGGAEQLGIAIEIKSDPKNLDGVRADWLKVCDVAKKYKLIIFAGVSVKADLERFETEFGDAPHTLGNGHTAFHLTHQDSLFGDSTQRKGAFIWIWYIDHHPPKQVRIVIDA
ncbi:hypothetical protein Q9L58_010495 [Maublancomyces gigas]|uniref:Restriction endonuclease n=1 Tax=Discina gigas TaxID=1032678 RepID=A0ABR3G4Y3_9PEZI